MKKFLLVFSFLFFSFQWLFTMEDLNEGAGEDIISLRQPIKKNKRKKRKKKVNLRATLAPGSDHEYLDLLNILANSLVIQSEIIKEIDSFHVVFEEYLATKEDAVQRLGFEFNGNGHLTISKNDISPECLSLVFKYPKIFKGMIASIEPKKNEKDEQELIETLLGWKHIDGITQLAEQWQSSSDSSINFFGKMIFTQLRAFEIDKKFLKHRYLLSKKIKRIAEFNGDLFYIFPCVKALPEVFQNESHILSTAVHKVSEFINDSVAARQQNKLLPFDQHKEFLKGLKGLLQEYKEQEQHFGALYININEEINKTVDQLKNKFKFLKFKLIRNCKMQPSEKVFGTQEIQNDFVFAFDGLLPEQLPLLANIQEECCAENVEENEYLPAHLTKPQPKQKIPQKKKKKKFFAKPSSLPQQQALHFGQKDNDGSEITEENEEYVLVSDTKNEVISKILKSRKSTEEILSPDQFKKVKVTDWVQVWYSDPDKALNEQGYTDINSKKFTQQADYWKIKAMHSPAEVIRLLLMPWAKQTKTPSRRVQNKEDILLTLPGVNYYSNGIQETGLFTYIIDSNNLENYHVNFESRSGKKLMEDYLAKGYFEVEFPSLEEAVM